MQFITIAMVSHRLYSSIEVTPKGVVASNPSTTWPKWKSVILSSIQSRSQDSAGRKIVLVLLYCFFINNKFESVLERNCFSDNLERKSQHFSAFVMVINCSLGTDMVRAVYQRPFKSPATSRYHVATQVPTTRRE